MTDTADKNSELEHYGVWVKTPPVDVNDSVDNAAKTGISDTDTDNFVSSDKKSSPKKVSSFSMIDISSVSDKTEALELQPHSIIIPTDTSEQNSMLIMSENDLASKDSSSTVNQSAIPVQTEISEKPQQTTLTKNHNISTDDDFSLDDILSSINDITPTDTVSDSSSIKSIPTPIVEPEILTTPDSTPEEISIDDFMSSSEEVSVDDFMSSSEEVSVDDFMSSSEEVSVDDFMSSSTEISVDNFMSSSDGEISLDDFMGDSGFSDAPSKKSPKEEKNDIIGDPAIDMNLTFDDNFVLETKADPVAQLESISFDGSGGEVSFDNFDDMFESIVDESAKTDQIVGTNSSSTDSIPDMQEFDPSMFDDPDLSAAIAAANASESIPVIPEQESSVLEVQLTDFTDTIPANIAQETIELNKNIPEQKPDIELDTTDMFSSMPDIQTPDKPSITTNSSDGFDNATEFDDFLKDIEEIPTAVSKTPERATISFSSSDYDLSVTVDDISEDEQEQKETDDESLEDISLFGDSDSNHNSITEPKKQLDISTNSSYTYTNELEVESIMSNMEDFGADISFEDITQPDASAKPNSPSQQEDTSFSLDDFDFPISEDLSSTDSSTDLPNNDEVATDSSTQSLDFPEQTEPEISSIPLDIDSIDMPEIESTTVESEPFAFEPNVIIDEVNVSNNTIDDNLTIDTPSLETTNDDLSSDSSSLEATNDDLSVNMESDSVVSDQSSTPETIDATTEAFDIPFTSSKPVQDSVDSTDIPDESNSPISVTQDKDSEDTTLMDDLTTNTSEASEMSNSILSKILDELSQIRSEITTLKTDVDNLKNRQPVISEESLPDTVDSSTLSPTETTSPESTSEDDIVLPSSTSGFFSDDVEDETIALSGDELNNILNTADFTEEYADQPDETPTNEVSDEEMVSSSDNVLTEVITPEQDESSTTISFPEEMTSNEELSSEEPILSEESIIADNTVETDEDISVEDILEGNNEPAIDNSTPDVSDITDFDDISTQIPVDVITSEEDNPLNSDDDFYDTSEATLPPLSFDDEKLEEPILDDLDFTIDNPDQTNNIDALPEEIEVPTVDDILVESSTSDFIDSDDPPITETLTTDRLDYLASDDIPQNTNTVEQVEDVTEKINSEESNLIESDEESIAEPTDQIFESSQWGVSESIDDNTTIEDSSETTISDTNEIIDIPDIVDEDTPLETNDNLESSIEAEETIQPTDEVMDQVEDSIQSSDEVIDQVKDSIQPSDEVIDQVEDSIQSSDEVIDQVEETIQPTDQVEDSLPSINQSIDSDISTSSMDSTKDIPVELKHEIKSVLSYMDQLLENLPEEKIAEFAKSEHFDVYKKLFSELGLS